MSNLQFGVLIAHLNMILIYLSGSWIWATFGLCWIITGYIWDKQEINRKGNRK